jgi:prephenate dehydrogenase
LRARELGLHVTGFDRDPAALAIARERGAIDEVADTFATLFAGVDTLVLAGPLDAILAQLGELVRLPPGPCRLILDVASVKEPVSHVAADLTGFVATHPIAGSERSGPAAARADLFAGRTWTLDADAVPADRVAARAFIEALGARPLEIASDEHDRTIALTSHLPQLVSVALGSLVDARLDDARTRELCGTGMRSMLRLAGSSWTMWRAVLDANAVSIAQEVRRLAAVLTEAADSLETHATGTLAARFTSANSAVARLGGPPTDQKEPS